MQTIADSSLLFAKKHNYCHSLQATLKSLYLAEPFEESALRMDAKTNISLIFNPRMGGGSSSEPPGRI